jgi:5-methyltetrahydrofolate--homocysteine methyltransferase
VRHARPLTIGLNCSFGAQQLRPHVRRWRDRRHADHGLSECRPAQRARRYDELPEQTAAFVREWAELGLVNILGGCCGSTPPHIAAIARRCGHRPRRVPGCPAAPASPASNP